MLLDSCNYTSTQNTAPQPVTATVSIGHRKKKGHTRANGGGIRPSPDIRITHCLRYGQQGQCVFFKSVYEWIGEK